LGEYPTTLREIITAGEQLQMTESLRTFFRRQKQLRLDNQYGPAETHVVTVYPLKGEPQHWEHLPPIGWPIPHTRIYLLSAYLQPVPIGVIGEIYIAGEGLAHGYFQRPDLTSERFLPDPFSPVPGSCMYRTGDLARMREDGALEFVGRADHQVKIRGYRIELAEIESALSAHPALREAAVFVQGTAPDEKRLVACIVPREPSILPSAAVLQDYLSSKLPSYMIPALYVPLVALPLSPNGKVDRRALPAPQDVQQSSTEEQAPPRDVIEEVVATIWMEVLHITHIGIRDNFFRIGGHSLLATRLILRLSRIFRVELPLHRLFETPTIAGLSAALLEYETIAGRTKKIALLRKRLDGLSEQDIQAQLQAKKEQVFQKKSHPS
jgi:hypothetical protein